jgi:hypothetical protein
VEEKLYLIPCHSTIVSWTWRFFTFSNSQAASGTAWKPSSLGPTRIHDVKLKMFKRNTFLRPLKFLEHPNQLTFIHCSKKTKLLLGRHGLQSWP